MVPLRGRPFVPAASVPRGGWAEIPSRPRQGGCRGGSCEPLASNTQWLRDPGGQRGTPCLASPSLTVPPPHPPGTRAELAQLSTESRALGEFASIPDNAPRLRGGQRENSLRLLRWVPRSPLLHHPCSDTPSPWSLWGRTAAQVSAQAELPQPGGPSGAL